MQPAIDSLAEVGVNIYDMQGAVKPVSGIIDELAKKWSSLSEEQQQNTAVSVAG